jgi:hypothetical protein
VAERAGAKARGWGVKPDHAVALTKQQLEDLSVWVRQKDLTELPPNTNDKPPEDPQLAKAVELLRAALKSAEPKPSR